MPGTPLGHYELLDVLGSGAMGVVYRARDTRLRRDVAIKVLAADAPWQVEARNHLLREARAISALNHPNICTVHDIDEQDGRAFIVMELVQGTPLTGPMARRSLDPETVAQWGARLADALAHAHDHGVVHRDLKPSNVVVTPEGHVKLVDFGVAARGASAAQAETALIDTSERSAPAVAGTPPYMAPEVLRGEAADARSDIWSLGVLLHEALSGERPFQGPTSAELTTAILRDPPKTLPLHVPPGLAAIVRRCLAKDPAARYQRAGEVRAALEALQPERSLAVRGRSRWIALAAAAIVLVAIAGAIVGVPLRSSNPTAVRGSTAAAGDAPVIRGLAVLPLRNIGGDASQDFFADGMTAALITELAKVEELKVISQTSAMRYRSRLDRPLPEIAGELGVDAVVEGSVLRAGDRVRITVNLVHAGTDRQLWADSYERPVEDVLALQNDIARAVGAHVQSRVGQRDPGAPASIAKVNPEAYELFLRGELSVAQGNPIGVARAEDYYRRAIAIDPGFAPAYAGLAGAIFAQEFWGDAEFRSNMEEVRQTVHRALALDPNVADAHVMMARVLLNYDWDYAGAERSVKRAIELSPGFGYAHETYCWVLLALGRRDEAIEEGRKAAALDPRSAYMVLTEGRVLHRVRRFREAEERYKHALAVDPGFPAAYLNLAHLYTAQKRFAEAKQVLDKRDRLPSARAATQPRLMLDAASGRGLPPPDVLAKLSAIGRARIYLAVGEYDKAFIDLDRAVAEKKVFGHQWTDPDYDPIRSDPRFARLLERMGLPVDRLVAWGKW